jgi:lysophospholipase L1-like esterase
MRNWFPEIVAAVLFPILLWQGKRTRRYTPRLPEAPGQPSGVMTEDGRSLDVADDPELCVQVVGIGESPVAGVGVASQDQAVTAQFARLLSQKMHCPVAWQAYGKNGATIEDAVTTLMPGVVPRKVDIVVIGFGVNDTTAFHSAERYSKSLHRMIAEVRARLRPDVIVVASVPQMALFPALPWPLNRVLGMKARVLDNAAARLVDGMPDVVHVPVAIDPKDGALMASDGYHPSEFGALVWARQIVRVLT